jgi:hypothetical protein
MGARPGWYMLCGVCLLLAGAGRLASQLPKCTCADPAPLVGFCNIINQQVGCGSPCCFRLSVVAEAICDGRCQKQEPIKNAFQGQCVPLDNPEVTCGFTIDAIVWFMGKDCPYNRVLNLPGNRGQGGFFGRMLSSRFPAAGEGARLA